MTRIAHISDLHFGRDVTDQIPELLRCLEDSKPQLTVITGDLTQRATVRQFQLARSFLDQMPTPCLVIPGNHDIPIHRLYERFRHPWKKWYRYIKTKVEPQVSSDDLIVIGLNSVYPMGYALNWSRGKLREKQIHHVDQQIKDLPDHTLRIIAVHHPFWLPPSHAFRRLIGGRKMALQAFQQSGIDMILSGHIHLAYTRLESGIIICHSGSSISERLEKKQKNSFNIIIGDRNHIEIKKIEWNNGSYLPAVKSASKRANASWQTA